MFIDSQKKIHLTYCSNIHPGESWNEVFTQLKENIPILKNALNVSDKKFGIGLRLSAKAAKQILENDQLKLFKEWLDHHSLYVFTINGFPYGNFSQSPVKESVYQPDWGQYPRLEYTQDLVRILEFLLPLDVSGSISSVPITYKPWIEDQSINLGKTLETSAIHLASIAKDCHEIYQRTGKDISIALEPEPDCLIETSEEILDFFNQTFLPTALSWLASEDYNSQEAWQKILLQHIGICYDTCHLALQYEGPLEILDKLQAANIRICKIQVSSALKLDIPPKDQLEQRQSLKDQLQKFEDPVYLHQVVSLEGENNRQTINDLPEALENFTGTTARQWRVHFHVPIFLEKIGDLRTTNDHIEKLLQCLHKKEPDSSQYPWPHWEIETYSFGQLPEDLKLPLNDSIAREYRWLIQQWNRLNRTDA